MADDPTPSDSELAIQAQAGDRHAFELLVHRHKDPLFRLVRRYIGSDQESYDVVQDSFISAWMALGRFNPEKPFEVWLRAIALNKCRDFGRRQTVRRKFLRFFAAAEAENISEAAVENNDREALEAKRLHRLDQAIAALPAFYKEPLLLIMIGRLSQQETAEQLHTTVKAIEMRVRRAKAKLAEALADLKEEI